MWRDEVCEWCGLKYSNFRADYQPTFLEAKQVMLEAAKRLAATGDYSKPARRAAVLGYMHAWKQEQWQLHLTECRMGSKDEARRLVDRS